MIIQKSIEDVCTSNADDLAYWALHDLATISTEHAEFRIVGGHMVNLIRLAFPTADTIERRTTDADAAIGLQIATDGRVHDQLLRLGYEAQSGNRYVNKGRTVDLLVPTRMSRFTQEMRGGRMFDAAPGLILDIEAPHLAFSVAVTLTTGDALTMLVRVPTLERAVILKSYALESRSAAKDDAPLLPAGVNTPNPLSCEQHPHLDQHSPAPHSNSSKIMPIPNRNKQEFPKFLPARLTLEITASRVR